MNPLMTRHAERHQIALTVRAAVGERSNMMHKCRKDVSALLFTHLTKQMPRQVSISNLAPCAVISLVLIVPTSEVVVVPLHRFLVRLAVAALSIRKVRTACHAAGSLRLSRHRTPPRGMKKPPPGLLPLEAVAYTFL